MHMQALPPPPPPPGGGSSSSSSWGISSKKVPQVSAGAPEAAGGAAIADGHTDDHVAAEEDESEPLPDWFEDDTAELALRAELYSLPSASDDAVTHEEAITLTLKALEVARWGPAAAKVRVQGVNYPRSARNCCICLLPFFVIIFLLILTRVSVRLASVRDNMLVTVGLPLVPGSELIVATGTAVRERGLAEIGALSMDELRSLRDVTLVHRDVWRCIRISRVLKYSNHHLWLEAPDGTALRLRVNMHGHLQAFIRLGHLANEELVDLGFPIYQDNSKVLKESQVRATALFDVVASHQIAKPD